MASAVVLFVPKTYEGKRSVYTENLTGDQVNALASVLNHNDARRVIRDLSKTVFQPFSVSGPFHQMNLENIVKIFNAYIEYRNAEAEKVDFDRDIEADLFLSSPLPPHRLSPPPSIYCALQRAGLDDRQISRMGIQEMESFLFDWGTDEDLFTLQNEFVDYREEQENLVQEYEQEVSQIHLEVGRATRERNFQSNCRLEAAQEAYANAVSWTGLSLVAQC